MNTRHEQEEQEDAGPVTFRVQADRRQQETRVSGAAERRATDAAGDAANTAGSDAAPDGKPH